MGTFDFSEALFCLKCGLVVSLTLGETERRYYMNQFGDIMCTPNCKENLTYRVNTFHTDAIMSNNWKLVD